MHILLLILKILGIIILSVLGLVLLILLIVLLAPIRYTAKLDAGTDKQSSVKLDGLVSWLLFIKAGITLRDSDFKLKVTAFRRVLFSIGYDDETDNDDTVRQTGETEIKTDEKNRTAFNVTGESASIIKEKAEEDGFSDTANITESLESGCKALKSDKNASETDRKASDKKASETDRKASDTKASETDRKASTTKASESEKKASDKQPGFFEGLYQKLYGLYTKIEEVYKIFEAGEKDVDLFLKRKSTKYTLELLKTTLIKLGNHSKPRRLSGRLTFGMDDPAATGYICAAISMFYGDYCDNLDITPDFTEKRLEGRAEARGRMILGYILALALNMYLKKQVRYCIKNVGVLKTSTMDKLMEAKDIL